MKRIVLFCSFVLLLAFAVAWPAAQQATSAEDEAHFTGKSVTIESPDIAVTRRRFDPAARTAWHSHPMGQLLLVQQGRLRMQKKGQAIKEVGPGESDFTGANVVHWHGAAADVPLVHVAVNMGGGPTRWLEKVTDQEYRGK